MSKILLRRVMQSAVDSTSLDVGEPLVAKDTGNVYVGSSAGKVWVNAPADTSATADKLTTQRLFSITGDGTAPAVGFDGSANVTLTLALATIAGLSAGTYSKVTVNNKGVITKGEQLSSDDIPDISIAQVTDAGNAASKNTGTQPGNVVEVGADGTIAASLMPAIALTDVYEANSQAAMLALTVQQGDVCVRSDINQTYILKTEPNILANWVLLPTPTDAVLSVNTKTGAVTLTYSDVGAEQAFSKNTAFNKNFETSTSNILMNGTVSVGTLETIARANHRHPVDTSRAALASPTFTGVPQAPTAATTTNTKQIATCEFVQANLEVIDGGTV